MYEKYKKENQDSVLTWIRDNLSLLEKAIGGRIIQISPDEFTEGISVKTENSVYWVNWDSGTGNPPMYVNDWGNSMEAWIYPNGRIYKETFDSPFDAY